MIFPVDGLSRMLNSDSVLYMTVVSQISKLLKLFAIFDADPAVKLLIMKVTVKHLCLYFKSHFHEF